MFLIYIHIYITYICRFECKSDGTYLSILHVSMEPTSMVDDNGTAKTNDNDLSLMDDSLYTGPLFEELDDEVQRQFTLYLEERGVNADLGAYLLRLVHDKEQREYMHWLEKVRDFVAGK